MTDFRKNVGLFIFCLVLCFAVIKTQDANCDFYAYLELGEYYYAYSPNYPQSYRPSSRCRWRAFCPTNTRCRINCTVEIPLSDRCFGDRLLISRTGDPTLNDADIYCGRGTLYDTSIYEDLSIGLVTSANTPGGRFLCDLYAITYNGEESGSNGSETGEPDTSGSGSSETGSNGSTESGSNGSSETGVVSNGSEDRPTCRCGWKKQIRIVGGQETEVNEYPMMVGLVDATERNIYCGGTIIHERWVLTAAHCLKNQQVSNVGVLYGEHDISIGSDTSATVLVGVSEFILHPQYADDNDYDVGLVRTKEDIVFSERVGPACLPFRQSMDSFNDVDVEALGWGSTSFGGPTSSKLQKVSLKIIDQNTCTNSLGSLINPRTVCTYSRGKDACQYDSGGPLLWENPSSGRLYLVGIIMSGYGCATKRPGLNSRMTSYLRWVRSNAADASFCNY